MFNIGFYVLQQFTILPPYKKHFRHKKLKKMVATKIVKWGISHFDKTQVYKKQFPTYFDKTQVYQKQFPTYFDETQVYNILV